MTSGAGGSVAVAIDIGGTKVEAALVAADGRILPGSVHRSPTGGAERGDIVSAITAVVTRAVAALPTGARLVGTGIGSAGPVDLNAGTVSPKNLPALADFAICEHLRHLVPGIPVVLRLDGTCIALAEHWLGATSGRGNSLAMVVSTGVGGGIILNNTLISGRSGNAGHIGQMQIATRAADGRADDATLEAIASGPRTVAWARGRGWRGSTGEELGVSYAAGDPIARRAVVRSATAVGQAITSVATLLDLEIVAIGGGFVRVAPDYLDLVRRAAADAVVFAYAAGVIVTGSALSGTGPILGAAALIHRSDLVNHTQDARPPMPASQSVNG